MSLKPGFYTLENIARNTVLGLSDVEGEGIQSQEYLGHASQHWHVEKYAEKDFWTFQSKQDDKLYYLDVNNPVKAGTLLNKSDHPVAWRIIEHKPTESIYRIVYDDGETSPKFTLSSDHKVPVNIQLGDNLNHWREFWKFHSLPIYEGRKDGKVDEKDGKASEN